MSKKGRGKKKGHPPRRRPHSERGAPPLIADAEARLNESSPFGLLAMASGLIEVTTPRPLDSWPGSTRDRPDGPTTFRTFVESRNPAMGALTLAVAAIHPDPKLAAELRAAVGTAPLFSGPGWLRSMGSIGITGAWLQTDVLGDGDNILISWTWPHGAAATAIVYVDHNMGTVVKDAFVIPEDGESILDAYADLQPEYTTTAPLDPAAARARASEGIHSGERLVPPLETETWPASRPMIEWVLEHLPEGGEGYVRPDWPDEDRDRLLDDFMASTHADVVGVTAEDVRDLADPLVWFGCDYGPGDPLRWSRVSVEIVLADWYPRKVFGFEETLMRRLPDVLAGFVRFAHALREIPAALTEETLQSVSEWREEFLDAAARPGRGPAANAARLARIAAGLDPEDFDEVDDYDDENDLGAAFDLEDDYFDGDFLSERLLLEIEREVIELVGGPDAYETLTDETLADVSFDWAGIPDALRQPTGKTLDLLDRWTVELFDDEVRTIARAVLAGVVAADASVFKRSPRADALAAAILGFLLERLTGRMSSGERQQLGWSVGTLKDIGAATGVSASTVGSRRKTVAKAVDRADIDWPAVLHSSQRREALALREHVAKYRRMLGTD